MCIFEMAFLYAIVFPEIRASIMLGLQSVRETQHWVKSVNQTRSVSAVVHALAMRESQSDRKVNAFTMVLGAALILVLAASTIAMRGYMNSRGIGTSVPLLSAVITVIALIAFQVLFYMYTKSSYGYATPDEYFSIALADACDDATASVAASAIAPTSAQTAAAVVSGIIGNIDAEEATKVKEIVETATQKDRSDDLGSIVRDVTGICDVPTSKDTTPAISATMPRPAIRGEDRWYNSADT